MEPGECPRVTTNNYYATGTKIATFPNQGLCEFSSKKKKKMKKKKKKNKKVLRRNILSPDEP